MVNKNLVVMSGTGLFTPAQSISNQELVASFNVYVQHYNALHQAEIIAGQREALAESSAEFIEKASGIKSRYVIDRTGILDPAVMHPWIADRAEDQMSLQCEMAVTAAQMALDRAQKKPEQIDAVLVACSNLQRPYPAIAIEVQNALGTSGYGYDMNVACSSATFGIQAAVNAIQAGSAQTVLVVNPEICSAHLEWKDRDCHFIFGDVCTAIILERAETCQSQNPVYEILSSRLKTHFSSNIRNNFGFLNPCDPEKMGARDKRFKQNGRKVFKEVVPMVSDLLLDHLQQQGISANQIKRLWLHQANLSMNQLIAKKVLGREASEQEAPVILDQYANTSSAGSVIAFHQYNQDLKQGDIGVLCSFGAGYSVGSILLKRYC